MILLIAAIACSNAVNHKTETPLSPSSALYPPAPAFSIKSLDGKTVSLADMKGKVIFVNFWATWCPPCRAEIPDFVEFYDENKTKGLEIIGLSLDEIEADSLLSFVKSNNMTYPVAFATKRIIKDFDPGPYIPTTIIIDHQGRIRDKQVGGLDKETLDNWFQKLSAEK
jgi:cytochrome c biogenesis protein CcmG/thiol:disulfide interchange protein DsbE